MDEADSQPNLGAPVDAKRMREIVAGFRDPENVRRNRSMQDLLAAGPAAIPYLQKDLRKDRLLQSAATCAFVLLLCAEYAFYVIATWMGWHFTFTEFAILVGFAFLSLLFLRRWRATTLTARLRDMLGGVSTGMPHARTVCLILDLWTFDSRNPLTRPLSDLLPTLKASDAELLTPTHREILHKILLYSESTSLKFAILHALEQIGDDSAVPVVEQVATSKAFNMREIKLIEAAQEALPSIRSRAETVRISNALLRAAGQPDETSLLRPASAKCGTDDQALLHSIGAE